MNFSKDSKEKVAQEEIESEEIGVSKQKKNFKKKIFFLILLLSLLAIGIIGGYLIDQKYNNLQIKINTAKNNFQSKMPGKSSITKSPDSIHLATDSSIPARIITVPNLKISFNAPIALRTGQELRSSIHDENNAQSIVRLYRENTKYTKDRNGYDVADNTIIFSFDYPYGTDPIFGKYQEISQTANTQIDKISFMDSLLASESARFYKYFDTQHQRYSAKYTDTYKAVIRMDIVTDKGKQNTVGLVYSCYDQVDKNLCEKTFQMFVSSVKIEQATFKSPPPTYTEDDFFSLLPFTKKNLNSEIELLWYDSDLFSPPFYREENVPAIAALKDEDLQNIRCMPQQLFFYDYANTQASEIIGVYTQVSDTNLNNITNILKNRVTEGYMLSQFTACQIENNSYLIKYNINKENTPRTKNDILHAKIAMLDDKGNFEDIVDIPNKNSFCSHFIALTKDNMLYFACVPFYEDHSNGVDMYKIDIAKKEYSQVYKCVFPTYPYPSTDMSKYCQ